MSQSSYLCSTLRYLLLKIGRLSGLPRHLRPAYSQVYIQAFLPLEFIVSYLLKGDGRIQTCGGQVPSEVLTGVLYVPELAGGL